MEYLRRVKPSGYIASLAYPEDFSTLLVVSMRVIRAVAYSGKHICLIDPIRRSRRACLSRRSGIVYRIPDYGPPMMHVLQQFARHQLFRIAQTRTYRRTIFLDLVMFPRARYLQGAREIRWL